jgi:hypothetical protein
MYIYHNTVAHLKNYCYHGKAMSITYSELTSAALVIQHAKCMHQTAIYALSSSTIFFHTVS